MLSDVDHKTIDILREAQDALRDLRMHTHHLSLTPSLDAADEALEDYLRRLYLIAGETEEEVR